MLASSGTDPLEPRFPSPTLRDRLGTGVSEMGAALRREALRLRYREMARYVQRRAREVEDLASAPAYLAWERPAPAALQRFAAARPAEAHAWLAEVLPGGWPSSLPVGRYCPPPAFEDGVAIESLDRMLLARRTRTLPRELLRLVFDATRFDATLAGGRSAGAFAWCTRPDATPERLAALLEASERARLKRWLVNPLITIGFHGTPFLTANPGEINPALTPALLDTWVRALASRVAESSAYLDSLLGLGGHPLARGAHVLQLLDVAIQHHQPDDIRPRLATLVRSPLLMDDAVFERVVQVLGVSGSHNVAAETVAIEALRYLNTGWFVERAAPGHLARLVTILCWHSWWHQSIFAEIVRALAATPAANGAPPSAEPAPPRATLAAALRRSSPEDWLPMLMHGSPEGKDLAVAVLGVLATPTALPATGPDAVRESSHDALREVVAPAAPLVRRGLA